MRLLLISQDDIDVQMAGPAIRYWELAHALARRHEVTLVAPTLRLSSSTVRVVEAPLRRTAELAGAADAVVTTPLSPLLMLSLRKTARKLIVDAYDPVVLESLENDRSLLPRHYRGVVAASTAALTLSLQLSDALVCASERQRDLWIGALMALGCLTPDVYLGDESLRDRVAVVPFGVPDSPPQATTQGARERFGLDQRDVVAVWGGGVWDWFDPATVIEGLAHARRDHPQLRLVFLGLQRPTQAPLGARVAIRALDDALTRTGERDRGVFVNEGWVPYTARASFLLDADLGVSAHFDHAETRFSFRTRVLDYLWAGLPCVLTAGDTMADLTGKTGCGVVVPPGDVAAWAAALGRFASEDDLRRRYSERARATSERFRWSVVATELERICTTPARPSTRRRLDEVAAAARYLRGAATASTYSGRLHDALGRLGVVSPRG